jgi:uncharacterized membrane protein YkoI
MTRFIFTILVVLGLATSASADVNVTLEQLPEPVRQTVLKEVKTGQITDIERDDRKDGSVVYEIEFVFEKVEYELDVAPDGKVLKKVVD